MRSIIQESSSITKAIEQGWEKAGKPKEFTIKVYEEEEKNFLGITTRSAKIGIFFEERIIKPPQRQRRYIRRPQQRRPIPKKQ